MRTTVTVDEGIFGQAQRDTGISEKSDLVRFALNALVEQANARRLILLSGVDPDEIPRLPHPVAA
jgi:Arc/MetJ family transcription regulator